ncbi:MAG: PDDEXK nuclease domain-containing protein [Gammaproteobacteria bacterium]|jgi:predicted nuclease of restriction endonuclease-like (RecB) superfamily
MNKKLIKKHKQTLYNDIKQMIEQTRSSVAATVNAGLTILYWQIGNRINKEILQGKRAEYGEEVVPALSEQLMTNYGNSFSEKNLRRMLQFAEVFPDKKIVVSLIRQLSWTHFIALIPIKDQLQREFYAQMCKTEHWSVRTLRQKINGMLFERTAISKKPKKLINAELEKLRDEDKLTPNLVFRDPYFLDFLGLKGAYQEKDLEESILREIENFILELGCGFTFVGRQKRMIIDGEDFYLDLLFFHRKLKRLIAIELKLGKFKAAHKGQMELYLRWLEENEMQKDENPPLGMILCAEKTHEQIELLRLNDSGIHIAEYFTELPPKELLEEKLRSAITQARAQIEQRKEEEK